MDFDTGTVQTYRFKSHAEKTLVLQAFKNLVQNTGLVPSAHAHVDNMPVSEPFREPPPFAFIFQNIQNGIEHFKVVVSDMTSVDRETIRYTFVLHLGRVNTRVRSRQQKQKVEAQENNIQLIVPRSNTQ